MRQYFLPTEQNGFTPKLLSRGVITTYTLILLVFNILSANVSVLRVHAAVDTVSILNLHNEARAKQGLENLRLNSRLNKSAQLKAQAMLETDCWDHYCPNGKSPWDFFDEAGYNYIYAGENLAEGFEDNKTVFEAWMNSKTHRDNILRGEFREVGIGIVYGRFQGIQNNAIIVVHFGTRPGAGTIVGENDISNGSSQSGTQITCPEDDQILNKNTFVIEGKSEDGRIIVSDNNKDIGESISEYGLFTFRINKENALVDGDHVLGVKNTNTGSSDAVSVVVDTIPPVIKELTLHSISKNETDIAVLQVKTDDDAVRLESSLSDLALIEIADNTWELEVPISDVYKNKEIIITAYDKAGNSGSEEFNLSDIKGEITNEAQRLLPVGMDIPLYMQLGIRRLINVAFIVLLLILLIIDYIALVHYNLPDAFIRTKTNYHISIFVILLLISIAGGSAGELLEGAAQS